MWFIWSQACSVSKHQWYLIQEMRGAFFSSGLPNNTGLDVSNIMAKVPCKEDVIFRNSSFRKAVSRYVRCYSQVSLSFLSN